MTFGRLYGRGHRRHCVLQHFGREVVSGILGLSVDHPDLEAVYLQVISVPGHAVVEL